VQLPPDAPAVKRRVDKLRTTGAITVLPRWPSTTYSPQAPRSVVESTDAKVDGWRAGASNGHRLAVVETCGWRSLDVPCWAPRVCSRGLRNDSSGSRRGRSVAHVAHAGTFNRRLRQHRGRAFSHADQSPAANARARHHPAAGRRRQPPCHVRGWRQDRVPEVDQRPGFSSAPRQPTRSTQSTAATPSRAATACKMLQGRLGQDQGVLGHLHRADRGCGRSPVHRIRDHLARQVSGDGRDVRARA
jgi:hypothetical protein